LNRIILYHPLCE